MTAYEKLGKYNSRMVLVAVGTSKREVDILGLTFGQKSITGSGGYSLANIHALSFYEYPTCRIS